MDDSYTLHGILYGGGDTPLTINDSDPDGDSVKLVSVTPASHGRFNYFFQYDSFIYEPNSGYTGTDSVTYQACDNLGLCDTATVTFNVVNNAPIAGNDKYNIHGTTTIGPLRLNDSDPDQADTLAGPMSFPDLLTE